MSGIFFFHLFSRFIFWNSEKRCGDYKKIPPFHFLSAISLFPSFLDYWQIEKEGISSSSDPDFLELIMFGFLGLRENNYWKVTKNEPSRFFSFLEFSVIYWIRDNFPILCYLQFILWKVIQIQ